MFPQTNNSLTFALILIVYVSVCICSSSQLTLTTPSWRRKGLISKSPCLRASVSDIVVSVGSLCTFCQIENKLLKLNDGTHCVLHSFSQIISNVKGERDHSLISDCMNKTGSHLFWLIKVFIFDFVFIIKTIAISHVCVLTCVQSLSTVALIKD